MVIPRCPRQQSGCVGIFFPMNHRRRKTHPGKVFQDVDYFHTAAPVIRKLLIDPAAIFA